MNSFCFVKPIPLQVCSPDTHMYVGVSLAAHTHTAEYVLYPTDDGHYSLKRCILETDPHTAHRMCVSICVCACVCRTNCEPIISMYFGTDIRVEKSAMHVMFVGLERNANMFASHRSRTFMLLFMLKSSFPFRHTQRKPNESI